MVDKKNFGRLGDIFQQKLLNQIISDSKFSSTILEVIEPDYFDNKYFRLICQHIKEYYNKFEKSPGFDTLEHIIHSEHTNESTLRIILDTISSVKNVTLTDVEWVQEQSFKFCKQQEIQKAINKAQKYIDGGDFQNYDRIETLISKAMRAGSSDIGYTDVFTNAVDALDENYRHPIPTGIPGIDKTLGGLAKGEVGVVIAPTGVGKTTFLTKISNSAFNSGYNVLQVFFEDNPQDIKRKHYTLWTKIHPKNLSSNKPLVMEKLNEIQSTMTNRLVLRSFPSRSITLSRIKSQIKQLEKDGIKIDMVIIDYIDLIASDIQTADSWKSQGPVMREFESMCKELNIAGWTAVQGNRESISADVVTTDQMGGAIEKAQVATIIITLAKSLAQKEQGLANIAITKFRCGPDGQVFSNCKFDNSMLDIDTAEQTTFLGHEEVKTQSERQKINELLDRRKQREQYETH
jgi:replicative DNA helicase